MEKNFELLEDCGFYQMRNGNLITVHKRRGVLGYTFIGHIDGDRFLFTDTGSFYAHGEESEYDLVHKA